MEISLQSIVGKGYADFWNFKGRYRVCKGSRASKKSKTTALNFIVRMMQHPLANALVVRKTFATLKDSCYSDLLWAAQRLGVAHLWRGTVNPLELQYLPTGQRILFRGLDNPLKLTSISVPHGVLCFVWCEECYELSDESEFNKLDLSIRGTMPEGLFKQFTLTLNPWSDTWWGKARFFDADPDPDIMAKTTTYHCNEWLDEADLRVFETMRVNAPKRYLVEGLAQWGHAEGLIYENTELADMDLDALRKKDGVKSAFGLDFGFTDPTAFVACLIDESENLIYVFDEFYETGLTNRDIAARIIEHGWGSQRIICDSSEPKSIQELRDLGIRAEPSRKGPDSVLHGIQKLQNYKIVVSTKCPNFWHEINNYAWQKDKNGKPVDKPEHEWSHCMDAARYCCGRILLGNTFSFE